MPKNLDLELLRTLVAIADCGGFTRAAERLHRTQSTVSLQMKRLEDLVGVSLFRRNGRQMLITESGEILVSYARRLLEINDEAVSALTETAVEGQIRFGSAQAFAEHSLPRMLARFARIHPGVRLEVRVDSNQRLVEAVRSGQLDLALVIQKRGAGGEYIRRIPLVWLAGAQSDWQNMERLPLVLFENPCPFRDIVLESLERRGEAWRVAYTSPSLPGLLAAVRAGLGITAQTTLSAAPDLRAFAETERLPRLPEVEIALHRNDRSNHAFIEPLARLIRSVVQDA